MWTAYKVTCPDCHKEITYLRINLNTDVHMLIEGICILCGHDVNCEVDLVQACVALARYEAQKNGN